MIKQKDIVSELLKIKEKLKLLDEAIVLISNIGEECSGINRLIDICHEAGESTESLAEKLIESLNNND
jgi:hypothetical protein